MTSGNAPGKAHRTGISLFELQKMFPDEESARQWFEDILWPEGIRYCPNCDSDNTYECSHAKMPYRCRDCRKYFSVKTGTVMTGSPLPLLKWLYAIYLDTTSLKGVSSMKLHRDLGITQKAAWHMQQRIRLAFAHRDETADFSGPVEVDETYMGGKRKNMSNAQRKELEGTGRGTTGKTAVVGAKDRDTNQVRAQVVETTDKQTLQGFVTEHTKPGAQIYTGPSTRGCCTMRPSSMVWLSMCGAQAHTNGMESFWSMLKRAHMGTFHKLSPKHLDRYVQEFAGRHNVRNLDILDQMATVVAGMDGRQLIYEHLIADNGLLSGARS